MIYNPIYFVLTWFFLEILVKYTDPQYHHEIMRIVGDYCGKPVTNYTEDVKPVPLTWSFYHAFFFSFTVCSTVGRSSLITSNFELQKSVDIELMFAFLFRLRQHIALKHTRSNDYDILRFNWYPHQWISFCLPGRLLCQSGNYLPGSFF